MKRILLIALAIVLVFTATLFVLQAVDLLIDKLVYVYH